MRKLVVVKSKREYILDEDETQLFLTRGERGLSKGCGVNNDELITAGTITSSITGAKILPP
jgi:hypothetical protein